MDTGPAVTSAADRLLKGSAWVIGGRILGAAAGVLVSALLARLLTPSSLGVFLLCLAVVGFASTAAQFGMRETAVRLIAEAVGRGELGRARSAAWHVLAFASVGAAIVGGVFLAGGWRWITVDLFHSREMASLSSLAVAWLAIIAIQGAVMGIFRGLQAMHLIAIYESLLANAIAALALLTIWLSDSRISVTTAIAVILSASVVAVGVAATRLRHRIRSLRGRGAVSAGEVANIGWAVMVTVLLSALVGSASDLWILAAYAPKAEVAVYGAALRLVALVSLPFGAVTGAISPLLAELNATGRQRQLERLVRSSTGIVGIPSVALLALFASLGAPVLGTVFGPFYERGAEVLAICSLAQCLFVLAGPCGMALLMTGHQRATVVLALITGVLSISGDIWAAPRFGAVGVAVATSSALILTNVAAVLLVKRWIGIWTIARFSVSDARAAFRAIGSMRGSERAARD